MTESASVPRNSAAMAATSEPLLHGTRHAELDNCAARDTWRGDSSSSHSVDMSLDRNTKYEPTNFD